MTDPNDKMDWGQVTLHPGVLREPSPENGRLVLWLPAERSGSDQYWQRVSSVPRATITRSRGLCSMAATAIRARQRGKSFLGGLLRRFRRVPDDRAWLLPNGETAEQCGERQTDLLLVWSEDRGQPLDETCIQEQWSQITRLQSLGPHLVMLRGVGTPTAAVPPPPDSNTLPPESLSLEQAKQSLDAARRSGDRSGEVSALADVGLLTLKQGEIAGAIACLEEALALARALGDHAREGDILGSLGLALVSAARHGRALPFLEQSLAHRPRRGRSFGRAARFGAIGHASGERRRFAGRH